MIVTFLPQGITYRVRRGGSLLRAAMRARVPLARSCRGDAVCASCRVKIVAGAEHLAPPTETEQKLAARAPLAKDERYACQAVVQGDVTITTTYW